MLSTACTIIYAANISLYFSTLEHEWIVEIGNTVNVEGAQYNFSAYDVYLERFGEENNRFPIWIVNTKQQMPGTNAKGIIRGLPDSLHGRYEVQANPTRTEDGEMFDQPCLQLRRTIERDLGQEQSYLPKLGMTVRENSKFNSTENGPVRRAKREWREADDSGCAKPKIDVTILQDSKNSSFSGMFSVEPCYCLANIRRVTFSIYKEKYFEPGNRCSHEYNGDQDLIGKKTTESFTCQGNIFEITYNPESVPDGLYCFQTKTTFCEDGSCIPPYDADAMSHWDSSFRLVFLCSMLSISIILSICGIHSYIKRKKMRQFQPILLTKVPA